MNRLLKTLLAFCFLFVLLFSGTVCFLFNEKVNDHYVLTKAKTYLVNVKGPLYAKDSFAYYSFDTINSLKSTSNLGLFLTFDVMYVDSTYSYSTAFAAMEPGRAGPRQVIDSMSISVIYPSIGKKVDITKDFFRSDTINAYKYFDDLSMFDLNKGWAGTCAGPNCEAYEGEAFSSVNEFVKAFNSKNVRHGYFGSSMNLLFFPDQELISELNDASILETIIHFTDGFSIHYKMKIRH